MTTFQKYAVNTVVYNAGGSIEKDKKLNGITFTNIGTCSARINGMLIGPPIVPAVVGDSVSIGGNQNEVYTGLLVLEFIPPFGANPAVEVTQKFYITEDQFK